MINWEDSTQKDNPFMEQAYFSRECVQESYDLFNSLICSLLKVIALEDVNSV